MTCPGEKYTVVKDSRTYTVYIDAIPGKNMMNTAMNTAVNTAVLPTTPFLDTTPSAPAANTPVANTPVANIPAPSAPTVNTPVANIPSPSAPTVNTPVANTPVANTPAPVANIPTTNIPAPSAPAPDVNVAALNAYMRSPRIANTGASTISTFGNTPIAKAYVPPSRITGTGGPIVPKRNKLPPIDTRRTRSTTKANRNTTRLISNAEPSVNTSKFTPLHTPNNAPLVPSEKQTWTGGARRTRRKRNP